MADNNVEEFNIDKRRWLEAIVHSEQRAVKVLQTIKEQINMFFVACTLFKPKQNIMWMRCHICKHVCSYKVFYLQGTTTNSNNNDKQ